MIKQTINRAYKTQLNPTKEQIEKLKIFCGAARKIYNWGLEQKKQSLTDKTKISKMSMQVAYTNVKTELHGSWCPDFPRVAMEYEMENLDRAFANYFRKKKEGKNHKEAGFPKFKSRYDTAQGFRVRPSQKQIISTHIYLTNVGWIKLKEKDYLPINNINKINFATVTNKADKWFVSLTVEKDIYIDNPKGEPVGLDLGIKSLIVCSDGDTYDNLKVIAKYARKMRKLNKELSRKVKRSNNWQKAKSKLSKLHDKIGNTRNTAIHQITHDVVVQKQPTLIGMENLNVSGMVKNRKLSKSINDAAMGEIKRQIEYKAGWNGTQFQMIDRFFPSTKMCSNCGNVKPMMKLSERTYKCEVCGYIEDRDVNASINIKDEAIRISTLII